VALAADADADVVAEIDMLPLTAAAVPFPPDTKSVLLRSQSVKAVLAHSEAGILPRKIGLAVKESEVRDGGSEVGGEENELD
jgi:hypothetical protein